MKIAVAGLGYVGLANAAILAPRNEVVALADKVGSTEFIIRALDAAEPGSSWAIGTELNLVRRLAAAHPDKNVHYLDSTVCFCSTMNRISGRGV